MAAYPVRTVLSQQGLLEPIKPVYNQSAGWPVQINSQCL